MLTPHPLLVPRSWKGRAIPLLPLWAVRPVQSLSACTRFTLPLHHNVKWVELYLCSPYGPYGLYRASVPVQGWPLPLPLHHNVKWVELYLYSPLWAVWPVQSLSACTGVHFYLNGKLKKIINYFTHTTKLTMSYLFADTQHVCHCARWTFPLFVFCHREHCKILTILSMRVVLSRYWYHNIIISLYLNCKGHASVSHLPFILLWRYMMMGGTR